jgi:hypothetical protein
VGFLFGRQTGTAMEKLTHTQLLNRLAQFSGAHYEAAAIEDHDFARECADMVSVITEVLETRTKLAGTGQRSLIFR